VNRLVAARLAAASVLVVAIAIAIVALATDGHRSGAGGRGVGVQYGANVNWLFDDTSYTDTEIGAQLSALRATGATLARTDALWEATEPTAPTGAVHHYNWDFDDRVASMLAAHGLRWLPIVDYSAPWAQSVPGVDHSPPSSFTAYAAYAGALALRYGPGGTFWRAHPQLQPLPVQLYEIWNEPDNPEFWAPQPDPAAYARLYAAASASILAAEPSARVLVGGLTLPARFLPPMLAALRPSHALLSGVAIHPYGVNPSGVIANVRAARTVLRSLGLGPVPLYVTEFGWTTQPAGALYWTPASVRPGYIETVLQALGHSGCGIDAVTLYTWATPEQQPRNSQQWYGLSPPGAGPSAGVEAFAHGLAAARQESAGGRC
jgi:hypothetical protein